MSRFVIRKQQARLPRLPLRGNLDLTYRCNNNCRHCWLRLGPDSAEGEHELGFDEIRRIVDEAGKMGCRHWFISGGEPMIRPDFADIFAYVTEHSAAYTLSTNGTLITPRIARLLKRKGAKLVALYGATADVHDHITRNPGSFEALKRGIAYLREEGAGLTVQVVPMKSNFSQYDSMARLAESWSPSWRVGASWLYLAADGDSVKNREIRKERLAPADVLKLDRPEGPAEDLGGEEESASGRSASDGLYAECIAGRRDFHIDPYGGMSFCGFVKDPALRLDLRRMSFRESWDERLPSLAGKVKPAKSYFENCGSCSLREDCRWCPVYAYLEHRDHSAKIDYLCKIAREEKAFKEEWARTHRRSYKIAGLTIRVEADLPITDSTFQPKFDLFSVPGSGDNALSIRHHFSIPDLQGDDLGEEIYRRPPWAISRKGDSWIYLGIYPDPEDKGIHRVIVFNDDHTRARIFNPSAELYLRGSLDSLMLLSSDQIMLARVLPFLGGAFIHAAGVSLKGRGLLFAGPSEAGKSTIVKMLKGRAKILCDDRIIVRKETGGFLIHGTWSHGEIPDVSPDSAPLSALFFLRQSRQNRLERIRDPKAVLKDLLPRLVRPLVTADWWERALALAGGIVAEIPCYNMYFDKTGKIVDALEELLE
jgi:radical SAM protein with 4Fe4S-binding SPASM domain